MGMVGEIAVTGASKRDLRGYPCSILSTSLLNISNEGLYDQFLSWFKKNHKLSLETA
jgi:hypothetical protein